jgi:signal transduction histidine kinase/CheY-like chemotaxis protein
MPGRTISYVSVFAALCIALLGFGFYQPAQADLLVLSRQDSQIPAGPNLTWIKGQPEMTPLMALEYLRQGQGDAIQSNYPSFGFVNGDRWLLLRLDNQSSQINWMLEAGRPDLDRLTVYLFDSRQQLVGNWQAGDTLPFNTRDLEQGHLVFPVSLPPGRSYLLLHAKSDNVLDIPVTLFTPQAFYKSNSRRNLLFGLYFGAIFILCIYNLLIFLSTRDKSYLLYVLYLGSFGLFLLAREGMAFHWLWPELPYWNNISMAALCFLTLAFSLLFTSEFLQLPRYRPKLNQALIIAAGISVIFTILSFFYFHWMIRLTAIAILPWPIIALTIAFLVLRQGYVPARYFIIAFSFIGLAVTIYTLKSLHLIEGSWFLENLLPACTLLEALLLSFALAHRMTIIKAENERIQRNAQQELEERVQTRTRELHNALNARSQFLAVMSHEIRTPLNGILGTLDMIKNSKLNEEQQYQVSIIEKSGNNLLQLINDILDYTRIEAGKMPINEEAFDLAALAHECRALFEQKAAINGNLLLIHVDPNVGSQTRGDAMRVRQILVNLISNAIKFTDNGRIDVTIRREESNPDYVNFSVKDTGIGIAEDKLSLLFDLFQQADNSTSRQYGGTGLGLAVCQQLVEILGGELGVESRLGEGSTFWFHLPLPESAIPPPKLAEDTPDTVRHANLLIVDDNNINLMVAQGLCQKLGHTAEICDSGAAAIATLLHGDKLFDVILMDCEMPIMDGFAATHEIIRLQEEGRIDNIPIVALTAHAVPDKIRACHEAGMVMHIAKPINLEKLRNSLAQLLRSQ